MTEASSPARRRRVAPIRPEVGSDFAAATDAVQLSARMPAGAALRHVLRELAAAIRVQERGIRLGLGSRHAHDFRVAVRRARCLLSQPRHVFRRRDVERWREGLHRLQRRTDALRNVDSLCEWLHERHALQGGRLRSRLLTRLRKQQASEQRLLLAELESPRHVALLDGLQIFLDRPAREVARGGHAGRPVVEVIGRRCARLHRSLLERRGRLDADSPADELHALRKRAKKLRDLLHATGSAFGDERVRPLMKALERLLDELGAVQDARVHLELVRRGPDEPALVKALKAKDRKARRRQVRRLEALGSRRLRKLVKRLADVERAEPSTR